MSNRDNFTKHTIDILADRAGHRCSNPHCRKLTSGPRTDPTKAVSIGVAAHITAAASDGPRYDPSLSAAERSHPNNGIWLCQNCAKLIDNDPDRYTVDLLRRWRKDAERDALQEVEQLSVRQPQVVPHMVPPLPPFFIPRPDASDPVKAALLAKGPAAPGVLAITALQGMGGIGKSVLAAALAHDDAIHRRFPDGVLWITIGQEPDLLSLLTHCIFEGLGDYTYKPTTLKNASAHLRTLLLTKAALLILDDVWETDHTQPFLVSSPGCRILITTRRAAIADDLGADLYELDVLTDEQSLALLSARLGRTLKPEEMEQASLLAAAAGRLPLALELAAARVARRVSWAALYDALSADTADLEALEDPARRRRGESRLDASLRLSLDFLKLRDQPAWQAFCWLGVLPEDATLSAPAAATLWSLSEPDADLLLDLLYEDGLLLITSPLVIADREWSAYRLHDLVHDMARRLLILTWPDGLGLSLTEAHDRVLTLYRARAQSGLWHTLSDDGYVHDHLVWHMEQAGKQEEIHILLRKNTSAGRSGWYEARERLGQTSGYLADVRRAWRLVESSDVGAGAPRLACRYALIVASLNSLAANIPSELLVALVSNGLWTAGQGLVYARQVPYLERRAKALVGLRPYVPEGQQAKLLREALSAARAIPNERSRAQALVELGPYLPKGLAEEALLAARTIRNQRRRAEALAGLGRHLPEEQRNEVLADALAAARLVADIASRAAALTGLVPHLAEGQRAEVIEEALAATSSIRDERARTKVLAGLAPHLPVERRVEVLGQALAGVKAFGNDRLRTWGLAELAPDLPEDQRVEVQWEAVVAARAIGDERFRARVLAVLGPHLPAGLLPDALAATRLIADVTSRATALTRLVPHLAEGQRAEVLEEALAAARAIQNDQGRVAALVALALLLPEGRRAEVLKEALAVAQAIKDWAFRRRTLAGLGPYLPDDLLGRALAATRRIGDDQFRAEALASLAPRLPAKLLPKALTAARAVGRGEYRVEALIGLVPHLSSQERQTVLTEALVEAQAIEDGRSRARALAELEPHLPPELLQKALEAAQTIGDAVSRAAALTGMGTHLPEEQRAEVLREALAAVRAVDDERPQVRALIALGPYLPAELLGEALAAVWATEHEWARAKVLAGLGLYLPPGLLVEALVAARAIRNHRRRAEALAGLGRHLPEEQRNEVLADALAAARLIADVAFRAAALTRLVPHLAEGQRAEVLEEALAAARAIQNDQGRVAALVALALLLPEGRRAQILEEALAVAQAIGGERARTKVLVGFGPYLPKEQWTEVVRQILTVMRAIEDESSRAWVLAELGSHLPEELLFGALAATLAIRSDEARARALTGLKQTLVPLPLPALGRFWRVTLEELATRTRTDLLSDLLALAPVLARYAGELGTAEAFRAIEDVGRWWP